MDLSLIDKYLMAIFATSKTAIYFAASLWYGNFNNLYVSTTALVLLKFFLLVMIMVVLNSW